MLRRESRVTLQEWTSKAVASRHVELKNLAKSLLQDAEAITAAMTESWSNGQVEGQVGRLKQIKRRMYGQHLARHDVIEGEDPAQGISGYSPKVRKSPFSTLNTRETLDRKRDQAPESSVLATICPVEVIAPPC